MPLFIDPALLKQLEAAALAAMPDECCGLLIGQSRGESKTVTAIRPVENIDDRDRGRRYTMEPHAVFSAFREAAVSGETVLGFYHSHPDGTSRPSKYDVETAWPDKSYLIVGVKGGRIAGMESWRLAGDGKAMAAEEIRLTSPPRL